MVNRELNPDFSGRLTVYLYQNVNRLIDSVVTSSGELGYSICASSEREAWRASINGLNDAVREYAEQYTSTPEITCRRVVGTDSLSVFGIAEARKHKRRGIEPDVFFGLYKYFLWAYLDTVEDFGKNDEEKSLAREFITKVFAVIEYSIVVEWMKLLAQGKSEYSVEE
jgi:hypothetical protein